MRNILFNVKVLERWDEYLPYAEKIINSTKHSETGHRPAELLFGKAVDLNRHVTYVPEIVDGEYATPESKEEWAAWMRQKLEQQEVLL